MNVVTCPHCNERVVLSRTGICPSCRNDAAAEKGGDFGASAKTPTHHNAANSPDASCVRRGKGIVIVSFGLLLLAVIGAEVNFIIHTGHPDTVGPLWIVLICALFYRTLGGHHWSRYVAAVVHGLVAITFTLALLLGGTGSDSIVTTTKSLVLLVLFIVALALPAIMLVCSTSVKRFVDLRRVKVSQVGVPAS